jgi:hypothetical protein
MKPGGQKNKQRPHLFALASEDIIKDYLQQRDPALYGPAEIGFKVIHFITYRFSYVSQGRHKEVSPNIIISFVLKINIILRRL